MKRDTTEPGAEATEEKLFDSWFDPVETILRSKVRGFLETLIEEELEAALARPHYGRRPEATSGATSGSAAPPAILGHRHGRRTRSLTGTFGQTEISVPRARITGEDGKTSEWKSKALRSYQRRTATIDALIASAYLSGTNTRRVKRVLASLFTGGVGKDVVSRVWRKVKGDWDAWNARSLVDEPIVRLILDGTVVRVKLDKKATSISLLVALGVRQDGQKVLLAVKNMGGESEAAWRALLDDLVRRGLRTPELVIVERLAVRLRRATHRNIYVRSRRAGERVMASVSRFLTNKLRLKVNEAKSAVARPEERKFLGFSISNDGSERRIAPKALDKFKAQIRDMTRRTRGFSLQQLIKELKPYIVGWRGYFGFCQTPRVLTNLEAWIRRRLRLYLWRQWRTGQNRFKELCQRGISKFNAAVAAGSPTGIWRMSGHPSVQQALRNGYFDSLGLPRLYASAQA